MDFREILMLASKGQGVNNVPKRYSLAVGPPKKDPKVKGVQSAAVQAFLRRKEEELRQKALEEKRRKEELVKKRIELKHDKKARAMAKRTKDNFHGYNGIPIEEKSKKRQGMESHTSQGTDQEYEMEEEDEFFEYNQAASEQEYEEEQEPPKVESKPKVPLKSAPPLMNFTDLLRLAEKKQYEPVEIKAKCPGVRQPGSSSSSAPGRPSTGTAQPTVGSSPMPRRQNGSSSSGPERLVSGSKRPASDLNPSGRTVSSTHGPGRPASSSSGPGRPISGSGGSGRLIGSSGGPGRPTNSPHDVRRPVSGSCPLGRSVSGPGRSVSGSVSAGRTVSSSAPGRPVSSLGPGRTVSTSGPPLKPKCTVVSETISSKNIISRSSSGQMNGMKPPLSGYRSSQGPQRLPFPSGYKRQREYEEEEDDEYDSEMEDFIEDEGEPQEEISKHIREIFGYDRKKYKDESDYALRYMESSWKEQQKEEAKSLRLGMQEDLEEMRREEEEMKRRKTKKPKRR
ncbi:Protein SPT2 like protein [Pteropus alecto]|uniref:Protein SPT2 homolog n=1 Tax=Pteropus alecto TaxID=9402 RepID=L5KX49_PTEAL|nr:Protein SPT2 like protein [Pteropus alecto]